MKPLNQDRRQAQSPGARNARNGKPIAPARVIFLTCWVLAMPLCGHSQQNAQPKDLANASLEDLMNIQVTSVSKTEQKVSETAAAIFVITQEDFRRSGATNIPDALRMVPGVQVAQVDSNKWAISARGLNDVYSNELLVLIDGRRVYTPTFGGVFWDVLDLPLEDIQQIEVIRGPGASVWGANAVNGVINIITKKAADTHGGLITARAGNVNGESGMVQFGGSVGKAADYRVYTKYFNRDPLSDPATKNAADGWHLLRGGFRVDSALGAKDKISVEGDLYSGREGVVATTFPTIVSPKQEINSQVNLSGGSVQAEWTHAFSARSETKIEVSADSYGRTDVLNEHRNTYEFDFQHHFVAGSRNDFVWGGGVRHSDSTTHGGNTISTDPARQDFQLVNAFAQDEIAVVPGLVRLTIGSKFEHSQYTGVDFLPSVRAAITPTANQTIWAAISRAVRSPDEVDASGRINAGPIGSVAGLPLVLSIFGNPHIQNERTLAYEAGYRASISKRFTVDLASYYNRYTRQETSEPGGLIFESAPAPPHFVLPLLFENLMDGETHGVEVFGHWKATGRWTISPGYAFERIHMHLAPQSKDSGSAHNAEGSAPVNSGQIRSHFTLTRDLGWDTSVYLVGRLLDPAIRSYVRLDTGLSWRFENKFLVGIYGQNLLQPAHVEFEDVNDSVGAAQMKRGGFVKLRWTF